ncbi:MAG: hypothetical protein QF615_07920, partial [Planctomycetota bacterium]|nr:hypothetical protein [Planctomycetota bacterium]
MLEPALEPVVDPARGRGQDRVMRRSPLLTAFCFCALAASPCSAALGQGRLADQAGPQDLDATQQQQKERAKPR